MNNKLSIFFVVAFVTALSNAEIGQENQRTGVNSANNGLGSTGFLGSASIKDNNSPVHQTRYLARGSSFLGEYVPSIPKYNLAILENYISNVSPPSEIKYNGEEDEEEEVPQSQGRLSRLRNYSYDSAKILGSRAISAAKSEIKRQASGYLGVPLEEASSEDAPISTQSKSYETVNALMEAMKNDIKNKDSNLQKLNLNADLKSNVDNLFLNMQKFVDLVTDTMGGPFFETSSGLLRGFNSIVPDAFDNGKELIKEGVNMAHLLPETWSVLISLPRVVFLDLVKLANGSPSVVEGEAKSVDYSKLASLALSAGLAASTGGAAAVTPLLTKAAVNVASSAYNSYNKAS